MPVARARLHALVRAHRALASCSPSSRSSSTRCAWRSAAAPTSRTTAGSPSSGTRFTLDRPRDRRGAGPVRDRRLLRLPPRQRLRGGRRGGRRHLRLPGRRDRRGPLPRPAARRQAGRPGRAAAVPDRPGAGTVQHERLVDERLRAAADQLRPLQRAALPLRLGRRRRRQRLARAGSSRPTSSRATTTVWSEDGLLPGRAGVRRRARRPRPRTRACCCRSCSTRRGRARSCSCSTPRRSRSSRAPRRRTTSRSASTGSSRAPRPVPSPAAASMQPWARTHDSGTAAPRRRRRRG